MFRLGGRAARAEGDGPPRSRPSYREGFVFALLNVGAIAALGLITTVVTARMYGIDVVGQFALVYAPTGAVWFLSTVREQPALIRALAPLPPRDPLATGLWFATFAFSATLTLVVSALAMVVTYFAFHGPVHQPHLVLAAGANLAGYLVFTNTGMNFDTFLAAFRAGRSLFWIRLHQAAIYLVFVVAFALIKADVWALVWAMVASQATSLIHRFFSVKPWMRWRGVSRAKIREGFHELPGIIRFGLKITPGAIADGVSQQVGTWVLGVVGTVPQVGAYNRAWMFGSRLTTLNGRINEMLFPTLIGRRHEGDHTGFDRALLDSLRYIAFAMLLPAAAMGGASHSVMAMFGAGFGRASDALALILTTPALMTMSIILSHALYAVDRPILSTWIAVVRAAVTAAATVVLALTIGVTGVALGLVIGCVVDIVWRMGVIRRYLANPMTRFWPARQFIALLLAFGSGFVVSRVIATEMPGIASMVISLPAGCAMYLAVFFGGGGIDERDRARVTSILGRFRTRRLRAATVSQ